MGHFWLYNGHLHFKVEIGQHWPISTMFAGYILEFPCQGEVYRKGVTAKYLYCMVVFGLIVEVPRYCDHPGSLVDGADAKRLEEVMLDFSEKCS